MQQHKIALLVLALSLALASAAPRSDEELRREFAAFTKKYNRQYKPEEYHMRLRAFARSLDEIDAQNEANPYAKFGVNKFSDQTEQERAARRRGDSPRPAPGAGTLWPPTVVGSTGSGSGSGSGSGGNNNATVNWCDKGMCTPIKDQGHCGDCWAFSATESIESMWMLGGNDMAILAPEQLVACNQWGDNCGGGHYYHGFEAVQNYGGMEPEADYPYTSGGGTNPSSCQFSKANIVPGLRVTGWEYAGQGDEGAMKAWVGLKPLSIGVDAKTWDGYQSGIMTSCGSVTDHDIQLVGYGTDESTGMEYWIVRNSWGTDWGMNGFGYLQMGVNLCDIQKEPGTVTVVNVDN